MTKSHAVPDTFQERDSLAADLLALVRVPGLTREQEETIMMRLVSYISRYGARVWHEAYTTALDDKRPKKGASDDTN